MGGNTTTVYVGDLSTGCPLAWLYQLVLTGCRDTDRVTPNLKYSLGF